MTQSRVMNIDFNAHYLSNLSRFSDYFGCCPVKAGPSGQSQRRDTCSVLCSGQTQAAAFPLLYPSVGFGSIPWTTAQLSSGFSKHDLQQTDHFARDFL